MKVYSAYTIEQFGRYILGDVQAFNWLVENEYRELLATLDAIRDDKNAFKFLIENKYFELAAFVNAIWDDEKAFRFLIDRKAFDWAATANFINGDDKAKEALNRAGTAHFVAVGHAILGRIQEDGDRNVSPMGTLKNMLNFRQAFRNLKNNN
ncbi:MAG: hypothetical protein IT237_07770 [Bacteroidia bacterium]|nr:hypothetical protein [Bacteroidia bacterium]